MGVDVHMLKDRVGSGQLFSSEEVSGTTLTNTQAMAVQHIIQRYEGQYQEKHLKDVYVTSLGNENQVCRREIFFFPNVQNFAQLETVENDLTFDTMHISSKIRLKVYIFFKFLCFERKTESTNWGWGRQRERERIPTRLYSASKEPDAGFELTDCEIMT